MQGTQARPPSTLQNENGEMVPQSQTLNMSKTLHVNINGTLNTFSHLGASAGIWKPEPGQHVNIFGTNKPASTPGYEYEAQPQNVDMQTVSLSNACISKITVTQCKSTFCVPVGVTMNCITGSEFTDSGRAFAFTAIPNSTLNYPQVIYETSENTVKADLWREKFPNYTKSNLESEGVLHIQNCPYKFVHHRHPVVSLMHHNPQLIGAELNSCEKVDGEWYKVTPEIFNSSCQAIRKFILPDVCTQNLCNFQLQLHRLDGQDWKDIDEHDLVAMGDVNPALSEDELRSQLKLRQSVAANKPQSFVARIKIDYTIKPP